MQGMLEDNDHLSTMKSSIAPWLITRENELTSPAFSAAIFLAQLDPVLLVSIDQQLLATEDSYETAKSERTLGGRALSWSSRFELKDHLDFPLQMG